MSSLKEKAKTSYSVCEEASLICGVCNLSNKCGSGNCPLANVLWVKLEDAEQTLNELKQQLLNIISECCACDIQLLNRKLKLDSRLRESASKER
jgi:hypothetical protein